MKYVLALLLLFPSPCLAKPLVASMVAGPSATSVNIDSSFTGTELFLFGARNDPGDLVMVIRGPQTAYTVRQKERVAGIWVNKTQVGFHQVDGFYALASNRDLSDIKNNNLLHSLGISLNQQSSLLNDKVYRNRKANREGEFSAALLNYKQNSGLYPKHIVPITFFGETLFSAVIPFPENIPRGTYIAEIYLFNSGLLTGFQSFPITVKKVGMDAFIFDFAYAYSVTYGVAAILLALGMGWVAGTFFRKV